MVSIKATKNILLSELERNRFAIKWSGILGLLAHPIYYLIWTYVFPQPYDNLFLRLSAAILCLPLVFQKVIPHRLSALIPIHWHFTLCFALPFVCTFLTIKNDFSTMWMMTEVMMIFIMALCIDHPLVLFISVVSGIAASVLAVFFSAASPVVLTAADQANLALLPVVLICSMACSRAINEGRVLLEKNKAMHSLASGIAHEMRNPLSQLKNHFDMVSNTLPKPSTLEPQAVQTISTENVNTIYTHISRGQVSINRGLQTIDMILAEVAGKPIDQTQFIYLSAAQTVKKAVDEYSYESDGERSKVSYKVVNEFDFKGNETAIIFIFFNLIKNALFYFKTKPGATITITVDTNCIKVRDTGVGISPERLVSLFHPFNTVGKTGGTGLGLSYCKRQMQAIGGDIVCESQVGYFTEFTLTFPAVDSTQLVAYQESVIRHAKASFKDKRFLVVDDVENNRLTTMACLQGLGLSFGEAATGQEAIDELMRTHYDLVLMDLNMPVLDGYAAAEKIRQGAVPGKAHIPIVAYTTESAYIAEIKTKKVGMNEFVSKPFSKFELIKTLRKALIETQAAVDGASAAPAAAFKLSSYNLSGKRVLVVNDTEFNREIAKAFLEDAGMVVLEAEHGAQALQVLASEPCDVVIMDMQMPGIDGLEATRLIRKVPCSYQNIPVIMLTGHSDDANRQASFDAGAQDFLTQPYQRTALYEKIAALVGQLPAREQLVPLAPNSDKSAQDASLLEAPRLQDLVSANLLGRVVPLFEADTKAWLEQIDQAKTANDFESAKKALHNLKGSSGNLGAKALYELVEPVYQSFVHGNWPTDPDWLLRIKTMHAQTIPALRRYLAAMGNVDV